MKRILTQALAGVLIMGMAGAASAAVTGTLSELDLSLPSPLSTMIASSTTETAEEGSPAAGTDANAAPSESPSKEPTDESSSPSEEQTAEPATDQTTTPSDQNLPEGEGLKAAIETTLGSAASPTQVDALLSLCETFGLTPDQAKLMIQSTADHQFAPGQLKQFLHSQGLTSMSSREFNQTVRDFHLAYKGIGKFKIGGNSAGKTPAEGTQDEAEKVTAGDAGSAKGNPDYDQNKAQGKTQIKSQDKGQDQHRDKVTGKRQG
ncbi:hypothetical protein GTO91_16355 [Heliobacterium undosum]|uniref:Uncharacterized protein n=1 Tax=Heliomicrobium undosum TaxID=121734 RepID=A0A845L9H9_9FIRM|nr:hypothetical protein [Heliomicrobium undosum]MZP31280.1 hypothetical protein [Heliomicrobium undosum]